MISRFFISFNQGLFIGVWFTLIVLDMLSYLDIPNIYLWAPVILLVGTFVLVLLVVVSLGMYTDYRYRKTHKGRTNEDNISV